MPHLQLPRIPFIIALLLTSLFGAELCIAANGDFGELGGMGVCVDSSWTSGCAAGRSYTPIEATYIMTARTKNELIRTNDLLAQIITHLVGLKGAAVDTATYTKDTHTVLNTTIASNAELRASITARFDKLPQEMITSDIIKQLRKEILEEVDRRIAEKK